MSWVKVDDRANEHRKQVTAGPSAAWLWACGLMYCNRQKVRDGFISSEAAPALYGPLAATWKKLADKLVEVGLWERAEGGYLVHDYHAYQPTPTEWSELQTKRRAAGSLGGKARAERRQSSGKQHGNVPGIERSTLLGTASKVPSKRVPDPDPGSERDQIPPPTLAQDSKADPGSGTVRRAEVLRTPGEPEIEQKRAESLAALKALESDPSFAAGGTKR